MATSNDYLISEKRCRLYADESSAEEVKQVWLTLADTYRVLFAFAQEPNGALIRGKRSDTPEAV